MPIPFLILAAYLISGLLVGKTISDVVQKKKNKPSILNPSQPPFEELKYYSQNAMNHLSITGNVLFQSSASVINSLIKQVFEQKTNSEWAKAMDKIYQETWIGGDHRMYDQSHTLWEAWLKGYRNTDYHAFESIREYVKALWNDAVTPKGLPIKIGHLNNSNNFKNDCMII